MNHPDNHFDRDARHRHAQALDHVSPQVRARLREARRAALASTSSPKRFGWLLAGGTVAAVLALMLASQLQPMTPQPVQMPQTASVSPAGTPAVPPALEPLERASQRAEIDSEIDGMLAALDENPDLYLWLAANDDALPPPSEY